MRMLRVSVFVILAAALAFIGIAPRNIFAGRQARQDTHRKVSRHQEAKLRAAKRPQIRVSAVKPAGTPEVVPGATGLVSVPEFTDDKQTPVTGGPALTIPLFNASTTNTITISSVSLEDGGVGSFTVDTDCTSLAPGASCNVFVTFLPPSVCSINIEPLEGTIDVANNDPVLDGADLQIGVEGYGSDGNFQIKNLTDTTLTPQQLAAQLVGTGVSVSNVTYTGAAVSAGTFTTKSNIVGFTDGIILSSGSVRSVVGPNCADEIDGENGTAGDPDLDTIVGTDHTTNDAAVLEFDFVPSTSTLTFEYVFASDEYNEFVGEFNDVFAFFLNGTNIALLPGITPATPVSINNVNLTTNPQFFINNDIDQLANPPVDTEMDGLTVVLTATAQVTAGQTNHIKLAIADADDFAVDSNVFIKAGSFTSAQITLSPASLDFGNQPQGTTSSPAKPITVTNVGNTPVTITSVVASANFGETDGCVGMLAANGTCTIQATFTPTVTGNITGTIQVNDDAAGSPQTVSLTGNGTTSTVTLTSIVVTPNPATVGIGGMIQFTATGHFSDGTTRDITTGSNWSSSDTEVATIDSETGIATGVALSDGAITIRATAVGTEISGTAQLTVSNVPIELTIPPPPGGTFGPVNPGGTLPVGVVLTADPGFTGTVTFSCTTDSPTITCEPRPASVTITSNGPLQVAIVVDTFCKGFLAPLGINPGGFGGGLALLLLLSTILTGTAWSFRKNPRWALSFALFVVIALGGVACNSLPRGANGVTLPGDYTLTISATVNGQTVSAPPVHFHVN